MPLRENFSTPRNSRWCGEGNRSRIPAGAAATAQRLFDLLESGKLIHEPNGGMEACHSAPLGCIGANAAQGFEVFARAPGVSSPSP